MGTVFDIQRFSVHDGDGIRTTVFLKGCNNRCRWCHNPESLSAKPQLQFYPDKCIGCGKCVEICPAGATIKTGFFRDKCTACGKCAEQCCTAAREIAGKEYTPEEVLEQVMKDQAFYANSGGGMTVSGGEPLLQADFCVELLRLAKEKGIGTAIETAGNVPWETFERALPYLDFVMYDMKVFDNDRHIAYTGVPNLRIKENLKRLAQTGKRVIVRTPVIVGVNATEDEIGNIAAFLRDHVPSLDYYELLPYHKLGLSKVDHLGMDFGEEFEVPPKELMATLGAVAETYLPRVRYGKD